MWQKIKDFFYIYSPFVVWVNFWDEENNEEYLTRISRILYIKGLILCSDWIEEYMRVVLRCYIHRKGE